MKASTIGRKMIACATAVPILAFMASCAQGAAQSKPTVKASPANNVASPMIKAPNFVLPADAPVLTELNLSEDNILDMMKQAITAFTKGAAGSPGPIGQMVEKLNLNQLYEAIKSVKAIRVTQFKMSASMDVNKTFSFLEKQVTASQGWQRVVYRTEVPGQDVIAIYARGKNFLGIAMSAKKNQSVTFGTAGFIDIPKLFNWFGNVAATMSTAGNQQHGTAAQPAPAPQPAQTPSAPAPNPGN